MFTIDLIVLLVIVSAVTVARSFLFDAAEDEFVHIPLERRTKRR